MGRHARGRRWRSSPRDVAGATADRAGPRSGAVVALGLGLLAVAAATIVGWNEGLLDALVAPPPILRAALVGRAVALGVVLLGSVRGPDGRGRRATMCPG